MANITIKTVKLSAIKLNPDNPRRISEKGMDRLVKSLQDFPEMMELREIVVDETMTVLGGNMRTLALRKIGVKECVAKIVTGLTHDQKREFIVKDNGAFGEWDFDLLANGFDDLPLADFGIDIPKSWGEDPEITEDQSEAKSSLTQNECPKCGYKWKSNEQV